jgi:hypothetical protein
MRTGSRTSVALLVAVPLLLPAIAAGQGTGGLREGGTPAGFMAKRDLDQFDPVKLLLDKKKDLRLDEAQKGQIETLHKPLRRSWDSLFKVIDKAQWDAQSSKKNGAADGMSLTEKAEAAQAQQTIQKMLVELRTALGKGGADAVALLTEEQKSKAKELLDAQRKEMAASVLGRARVAAGRG